MRPRSLIAFSALAVAGLVGCEKDDQEYKQYVDQQLDERFAKLEDKLGAKLDKIDSAIAGIARSGAAAGAARPAPTPPPRQRPATPDPKVTYAVPIGDSPFKGAEHAKVTIIEAFEFA
jgi:hypothetical protein